MGSRERKKAAASSQNHKSKEFRASTSSSAGCSRSGTEKPHPCKIIHKILQGLRRRIHEDWILEVNVESVERGFVINVYLERNSPGLLVRILEVFEKLGLEVLDATVSCSDSFQLQAVGEENEGTKIIKPQVVKKAVKQAIKEWSESESNGQA